MFPNEDMKPVIAGHYLMGLEHRKIVLNALPPGGRMLEWGSGDSTLWFKANKRDDQLLYSFENSEKYARKTGATYIPFRSGRNATDAEEVLLPGWEDYVNAPNEIAGDGFDVILVDGVVRNKCLLAATKLLRPGGTVFLHDAERKWYEVGKQAYAVTREYEPEPDYPGRLLWEGKEPCLIDVPV